MFKYLSVVILIGILGSSAFAAKEQFLGPFLGWKELEEVIGFDNVTFIHVEKKNRIRTVATGRSVDGQIITIESFHDLLTKIYKLLANDEQRLALFNFLYVKGDLRSTSLRFVLERNSVEIQLVRIDQRGNVDRSWSKIGPNLNQTFQELVSCYLPIPFFQSLTAANTSGRPIALAVAIDDSSASSAPPVRATVIQNPVLARSSGRTIRRKRAREEEMSPQELQDFRNRLTSQTFLVPFELYPDEDRKVGAEDAVFDEALSEQLNLRQVAPRINQYDSRIERVRARLFEAADGNDLSARIRSLNERDGQEYGLVTGSQDQDFRETDEEFLARILPTEDEQD